MQPDHYWLSSDLAKTPLTLETTPLDSFGQISYKPYIEMGPEHGLPGHSFKGKGRNQSALCISILWNQLA
jgi:hypothetical protein